MRRGVTGAVGLIGTSMRFACAIFPAIHVMGERLERSLKKLVFGLYAGLGNLGQGWLAVG